MCSRLLWMHRRARHSKLVCHAVKQMRVTKPRAHKQISEEDRFLTNEKKTTRCSNGALLYSMQIAFTSEKMQRSVNRKAKEKNRV